MRRAYMDYIHSLDLCLNRATGADAAYLKPAMVNTGLPLIKDISGRERGFISGQKHHSRGPPNHTASVKMGGSVMRVRA